MSDTKKVVSWMCCDEEFDQDGIAHHLKSAHGIIAKTTKGERRMVQHIDGRDFFSSHYEWTFGDVKLYQLVHIERDDDDMMRFA